MVESLEGGLGYVWERPNDNLWTLFDLGWKLAWEGWSSGYGAINLVGPATVYFCVVYSGNGKDKLRAAVDWITWCLSVISGSFGAGERVGKVGW